MALVVLVLVAAPGVAMAKGPLGGSVSGPGLASPIELDGTGEWEADSPLALLTTDTGIFGRAGHVRRPAGELGPRYDVRLVFPRHSTGKPGYVVRQRLYPYAEDGPAVYTGRGQRLFDDTTRTAGGWYRVPRILIERLGLSARPVPARATVSPEGAGGGWPSPLWAIGGVAMLAVAAWRATAARSARESPANDRQSLR
jgi:hypothetical protein